MMNKNARNRYILASAALALTIGSASALKYCKGREPAVEEKVVDSCALAGKECREPAAKKADGKCQAEQGERTPGSSTFDWSSCKGFCGDGEVQSMETADNCPLDVNCGDGKLNASEKRVFMKCADDACSSFETFERIIKESCREGSADYCASDCGDKQPPREVPDAGAPKPEPVDAGRIEPIDAAPPPAKKSGGSCTFRPGESFCPKARNDLQSRLDSSKGAVLSALSDCSGPVRISASISVDSSGTLGRPSATVTCDGKSRPEAAGAVNLSGLAAGRQCTYPPENAPCSLGASAQASK